GKILFEEEGHPFVQPKALTKEEANVETQRYFDEWSQNARGFLKAEDALGQEYPKQRAFLLHQATEALYHCLLLALTLYSPKSHRIKVLRSKAEDLDKRIIEAWPRDNRIARRRFELLSRAYVEARYSPNYEITIEDLAWLVERVKVLQRLVAIICRERLS
ncbi:HEPN domain-containing protein, partial [Rhizobium sp. CF142]|uniref:HEPN domain-containing protein n=1 Tax=Rhizobium sp. CF142 TaxID=1144314 RepID=UPI00026EE931